MPRAVRKTPQTPTSTPDSQELPLRIVGIGASAGGLEAFTELVRELPVASHIAYVLVQHLDPTHRSLLSELLGRSASLPVREVENNTRVEANQIYVIPPNSDMEIVGGVLKLTPREKNAGPARSIDHFLKSLAKDQGPNAVGVILSGAGSDGALGLKAIKDAGGLTFAQDNTSSKYDSMPRSAVATGCVDFVLPPEKIATEIARALQVPGHTKRRAAANARNRRGEVSRKNELLDRTPTPPADWPAAPKDATLRKIFLLLRSKTALDFSLYRMNTIRRRLNRRIGLAKCKGLEGYLRLLREDPAEVEALYQDLLIGVTAFFRNPQVFETLKKTVFPKLLKNRSDGEPLRCWIAGCSTGQEAYTYAMAYAEFQAKSSSRVPIQIFATDVNASALETARFGRYTKSQLEGVSAKRLNQFFVREHDVYRVQKSIRDMVIFAPHNLLTDPPFTRVDLISCRNMLIYIEPALQQKIIPSFHYALRPNGYLVLGTSESIGSMTSLFSTVEKTQKVYQKKPATGRPYLERPLLSAPLRPLPTPKREPELNPTDAFREADRLTLGRYGPPGILVNEDGDVLQFRGKIQPFLAIASGKATLNVTKMARGNLAIPLQKALQRARTENRPVREKATSFDGPRQVVTIEVFPFKSVHTRCFLVLFVKQPPASKTVEPGKTTGADRQNTRRFADLKREYTETRDQLGSLREQYETIVEELQASNEEVQSSNEELQSLNEELETSNEELESANEELTTLNEELATRNAELRESEQRLREQAQLVELAPLLARSTKDRIIFWNRGAEKLYGYTKDEALGQTSHLLLAAQYPEPLEAIQAKLQQHGHWEGEVIHRRKDGSHIHVSSQWVMNVDGDGKLRAVLEVNTDVSARKRAEESLRQAQELNKRVLETTPDCVMVLNLAGRLQFLNPGGARALNLSNPSATLGRHWNTFWSAESRAQAETAYRSAVAGETARFQASVDGSSPQWWDVVLEPIRDASGHPEQLLAVCRDVTDRKHAELATQHEARLTALRADVAVQVARGGELQAILLQLAQLIAQHTQAACVRLYLAEPGGTLLKLQARSGAYVHLPNAPEQIALGEGPIGTVAATKRSLVSNDVANEPAICDPEWARQEGVVSFAGFPLLFDGRLLGVLALLSRQPVVPRFVRELGMSADAISLLIQRKEAEDERNRLLQEAMEARNTALAASRAKDEFLAALSHELRTPLNPVLLLASDGADNPELPAHVRSIFATIWNNIRLEAKLIDDLLDVTRIAHGKLSLELKPMDLNTAVADAVDIVSANVDRNTIHFVRQLDAKPSRVLGDAVRLQQVFWNLLNNAVKFTPNGGTITVRTATLKSRRILVQVQDTGIGLQEKDLARIFDAFTQIERRQGGLGLGLAISRQLIEKHNGSIRAFSEGPGHGSTFEIELPLAPAALDGEGGGRNGGAVDGQPPRAALTMINLGGSRRRLLLVEDHASTRNALRGLLIRRRFDVVAVGSVAEALRTIESDDVFDLVISDLGLPDGDGCELVSAIREKRPDLRAIALSGYGTEQDRSRSREAGFVNHLIKPVSIDALDQVIAEVLGVDGHARANDRS